MKKFLLRHLGNMGDMVFFVPPVLQTLKQHYPDCHITFVTSWGYKERKGWLASRSLGEGWGKRNQGGHSLHLLMTNPNIDQLIHWHDTKISLTGAICREDGQNFPTWNASYYNQQKNSGDFDEVYELDFGLKLTDNPIKRMYEKINLPNENYTNYQLYLTDSDKNIAAAVMKHAPHPRIVLIEALAGPATRNWDTAKITSLQQAIKATYGVSAIWFGAKYTPDYLGRPLSLRENIATLTYCDVGIGVLSGPIHFAVAVGLPTLTLYSDHPIHRAAPAYFLNKYIAEPRLRHRTLLGAGGDYTMMNTLKSPTPNYLTPAEKKRQKYKSWGKPGLSATKSGLSVITVDEIMLVLSDMMPK